MGVLWKVSTPRTPQPNVTMIVVAAVAIAFIRIRPRPPQFASCTEPLLTRAPLETPALGVAARK